MGQLRNDHDVRINEITVSHRALSNSPHDAVTFDAGNGIRGVTINGKVWTASEETVIRSVNVSFDGVSVECTADFLLMLSDLDFRKAFVTKVKAEHAEQLAREEAGLDAHVWEKRPDKDAEHPGFRAWQCALCKQWCSVKMVEPGEPNAGETSAYIAAHDEGDRWPGEPACTGKLQPDPAVEAAAEKAAANLAVDVKNAEKKAKRKGQAVPKS